MKIMAIAYKGGKCQCCGYDNYSGALEFHHIN
uniref:GROUP II INTRON-ENCODED PROTEIN LTRA/RNA, GROUP II INTRONS, RIBONUCLEOPROTEIN.8A n=1 Tax=Podoviridae sp. ct8Lf7 TaxID=2827723 RepID=A0A8S5S1L2_9CAUD|nr:MAG TPA: GROUP II INTRON-ENCODED PROTEIN LTRA/RNA, GROUP II INTRONS, RIBONUCLEOPROTEIN.8A [Podoviridae sp. ct8Lf7]